jgi:peptidoglycan hydrolase-like protein with peptidoglycan-binding domain
VLIASLVVVVGAGGAYGVNQLSGDDTADATTPLAQASVSPSPAPEVVVTPEPVEATPEPAVTPDPEPTESPEPEPLLAAGDSGDQVRDLQARLKQIGWFEPDVSGEYDDVTVDAVSGFQARRELPETGEVDDETWDRLVAMTQQPTDDEMHNREPEPDEPDEDEPETNVPGLDPRCATGRALCIDKTSNSLRWVVDGQVKMTLDVRFGSELTPTREGGFQVGWKSRDHVSSLYDTPMPYAMFFSGGQAVHYSPDFAQNGYNGASHGCVNVRDKDAIASLFDQVKVGDKVIVYRS